VLLTTGVDLSKILGGQKVVKSDKCMGVSQLLGARARAAPPKSTPMLLTGFASDEGNIDITKYLSVGCLFQFYINIYNFYTHRNNNIRPDVRY